MVYTYICENCSHLFDKLYSSKDNQQVLCPRCGSTRVKTQQSKTLSDFITSHLTLTGVS